MATGTVTAQDTEFFRLGPEDCTEVAALEALCFATPWTKKQFDLAFTQNVFSVFGLRHNNSLVAYIAVYHAAGELEILNIAVHPDWRQLRLGTRLLSLLLQVGHKMGINRAFLEVRRSNEPAIALYERHGFEQTGIRKGYYTDTNEDALVYCCELDRLRAGSEQATQYQGKLEE